MQKNFKTDFKSQNNPRWKGVNAGYKSIHQWLKRNHGSPMVCDKCRTIGKTEENGKWSIQWALKKGMKHDHDARNYIGLCRLCHAKYDWTPKRIDICRKGGYATRGIKSKAKSKIAKGRKRDSKGHFIPLPSKQ